MDFVLSGHVISLLRSCLVALAAGHAAPKEFNVELYIFEGVGRALVTKFNDPFNCEISQGIKTGTRPHVSA